MSQSIDSSRSNSNNILERSNDTINFSSSNNNNSNAIITTTAPSSSLEFLKSVVNNEPGCGDGGLTDSDKENDHRLLTIVEETADSDKDNSCGTIGDSSISKADQFVKREVIFSSSNSNSISISGVNYNSNSARHVSEIESADRTMTKGDDLDNGMWDDFYNDEDFKPKSKDPLQPVAPALISNTTIGGENSETHNQQSSSSSSTTGFEVRNLNTVLERVEEDNETIDDRSLGDDYSSNFDSKDNSIRDDGNINDNANNDNDKDSSPSRKKKHRKKKLFKRRQPPSVVNSTRDIGGPSIVNTTRNTGGSHPDLGRHDNNSSDNNSSRRQTGHHQPMETMSETGSVGDRGGRRLSRRKQVSRPRCAGPDPSGDVLQQKYQELEHLMLKPLPNPAGYVKQTRQHMIRLQGLGSQYHASNHMTSNDNMTSTNGHHHVDARPPPQGKGDERRTINHINIEPIGEEGYSTLRTIQIVQGNGKPTAPPTGPRKRPQTAHLGNSTRHTPTSNRHPRPSSAHHVRARPASSGRERPSSASNTRPSTAVRSNSGGANNTHSSSRGRRIIKNSEGRKKRRGSGGTENQRSDSESKDRSSRDSRDSKNSRSASSNSDSRSTSRSASRSKSRSPGRTAANTDTFLKHTDNPKIRDWLKMKNKELRAQKREERKKRRDERAEKQEAERKKQEYFQDSEKRVKEWMIKKKKDALKRAREEKKMAEEEEMERIESQKQGHYTGSLRVSSIERPQSAPSHKDRKMFIPVIRPENDQVIRNRQSAQQFNDDRDSEIQTPQPPKSKFVYKRPVSGRVRLMKLQQERKEDTRKNEMKKKEMEKLTEDEKNRKMRMSYDQWLLKKRQEDYQKRQLAAKQRALSKSDPDLNRIVPEMARRRIENLQRGKRQVRTNVDSIDADLNKSFGGGDFGEGNLGNVAGSEDNGEGLKVAGQKKSLGERPSSAQPLVISNGPLNPQMSRSPRRPKSAHPRVQSSQDESDQGRVVQAKSFQLPFPPDLGVPKYVAQRQEKLFSSQVVASASHSLDQTAAISSPDTKSIEGQSPTPAVVTMSSKESSSKQSQSAETSVTKEKEMQIAQENGGGEENEAGLFFVTQAEMKIEREPLIEEFTKCAAEEMNLFEEDDSENEESDADADDHLERSRQSVEEMESGGDKECEKVQAEELDSLPDNREHEKHSAPENDENQTSSEIKRTEEEEVKENEADVALNTANTDLFSESNISCADGVNSSNDERDNEIGNNTNTNDDLQKEMSEGEQEEQTEATPSTGTEENYEYQEDGEDDDLEPKSECSEGRSSVKHVSFSEEAIIHEDPLAGIPQEDYEDYELEVDNDEAEDERGDFFGDEYQIEDEDF